MPNTKNHETADPSGTVFGIDLSEYFPRKSETSSYNPMDRFMEEPVIMGSLIESVSLPSPPHARKMKKIRNRKKGSMAVKASTSEKCFSAK